MKLGDLGPLVPEQACSPKHEHATAEPVAEVVVLTLRVSQPNYVPSVCSLRTRISEDILIVEAMSSALPALESDPLVLSISAPRRLRTFIKET